MKTLKIFPLHCFRCGGDFYPSLDTKTGLISEQKKCPLCNNKYWKTKVSRHTVSKMLKK